MKFFATILLLASVSYAQSGSSTSSNDPLIPNDISSGCASFLTQLNTDPNLLSCSTALIKATSAFGAGSNSTNASSSTVNTALTNLCGATSSCSQNSLRSQLTSFYASCQPELTTSAVTAVIRIYDVLYALFPLTQAVCSKGDDGKYCAVELGSTTSSGSSGAASPSGKVDVDQSSTPSINLEDIQNHLWTPVSASSVSRRDEEAFYPNTTTFRVSNILFLLLQPTLPTSSLCQPCTRSVLSSYISFESAIPYACGLSNSPLMSGQTALYQAVQNLCGASFLSGSVQAAGSISGSVVSNGASDVAVSFKALGATLATVALGFYATL
jgi:hypothetical protein